MKRDCILLFFSLTTLTATGAAAAGKAIPVSPGSAAEYSLASGSCPGFSWAPAARSVHQRIVVFAVEEGGSLSTGREEGTDTTLGDDRRSALDVELPGSASSWTPPGVACLEPGAQYAWVVGSTNSKGSTAWSAPSFFRVPQAPSPAEIARALEVLEQAAVAGLLPGAGATEAGSDRGESATTRSPAETLQPAAALATATAAIRAELADVTGEAVGVIGISNSPQGAGVLAANADATGGADLVLDGTSQSATDTELTEAGIDRFSSSPETFNIQNSGPSTMTLLVDGDPVLSGDSSVGTDELANGSVTLNKIALNAVDSQRIVDFSIGAVDLAPDSVTFTAIQADAVRSIDIKDGEIFDQDINANAGIDITKLDLTDKIDGIHLEDTITLDAGLTLVGPSDVQIEREDAVTDGVSQLLNLVHRTTGTPTDGMGASLAFRVEDPTNILLTPAEIVATQDTFTPRTSSLSFKTYLPPSGAPQERMSIDASGNVNVVNDLIVGGSLTVADMAIDTAEIADGAVTETKLATSVAGNGLTGGGGSPLAVGADDASITVTANGISVGVASDVQVADDLTIDGGTMDDSPIGDTTPSTGAFTDLAASGDAELGDDTSDTVRLGGTIQGATPLVFEGATSNALQTSFAIADPTDNRLITFPNATGVVQLSGGNLEGNGTLTLDGGTTTISAAELNVLDGGLDAAEVSGTNAQNLFATVSAPNGTNPVADTTTDTLTLAEGSAIRITGSAPLDGISIAVADNGIDGAQLADSITLDAPMTIAGNSLTLGSMNTTIIDDVLGLTPRATAPTCSSGAIYYDSDDNTFCFCEGGSWTPLDSSGLCS